MLPEQQHDTRPPWETAPFAHAVLGASLRDSGKPQPQAASGPCCSVASLLESLKLCERQLVALHEGSASPVVRGAATKVAVAFKRCIELCGHMPLVKDQESFYSLLAPLVARIKALEPGGLVVVPAGWKAGIVLLVLHCRCTRRME